MDKHIFIDYTDVSFLEKFVFEVWNGVTKFDQDKHKIWGYEYKNICFTSTGNTHDLIFLN